MAWKSVEGNEWSKKGAKKARNEMMVVLPMVARCTSLSKGSRNQKEAP